MKPRTPIEPKAQAIKLLARREHSARDLQRKLEQRGIPEDEAARAIDEVRAEGWQSDSRFAQLLVRSRVSQGYGPLRIRAELEQAAVPREDAQAAMEEAGADWRERCADVHRRRFRRPPASSAERAKQYRFLAGRGFEAADIGAVLKGSPDD